MLSPRQKAFFQENGYLAIEPFLDQGELKTLRATVDRFVEEAGNLTENTERFDIEPVREAGRAVVRRLFNPTELDEGFWSLCRAEKVLDVVENLIGSDIEFHHGKVNLKAAKHGSEVGWHQDLPFFPHTNTALVALMFYLDDSTPENGNLQVIPGTHRLGPLDHFADGQFIGMVTDDLTKVDLSQRVDVSVRAGGASIHHCLILHSSAPNRSAQPRRVVIFEYRAADARRHRLPTLRRVAARAAHGHGAPGAVAISTTEPHSSGRQAAIPLPTSA